MRLNNGSTRREHSTSKTLGVLALVAAATGALSIGGCFGAMSGRSSSDGSSADSESYTGTVTIENRSQFEICRINIKLREGSVTSEAQLSPGGTTQVEVSSETNRIFLTECGGQRTLYGSPMNWYGTHQGRTELMTELAHDRIVLYDPGQAPGSASDHRALELNPRPVSDWIFYPGHQDGWMAQTVHQVLTQHASRQGWSEHFEFSIPLNDWSINRNRYTGIILNRTVQAAGFARWDDGHCTMQAFGYVQQHNGGSFSGPVTFNGVSTQLPIPCAALELAANMPSASPNSAGGGAAASGPSSSPAGGGMCTNTCASANDGECDDGGPNSLYSVCALGTDCGDCGPR